MDEQTVKTFKRELELFSKYNTKHILEAISNVNIRLSWNVNSICSVFSRSKHKWCIGKITKIIHNGDSEWLIVKYNDGNYKRIQRFCFDIQPISINTRSDDESNDNDSEQIIQYIRNRLMINGNNSSLQHTKIHLLLDMLQSKQTNIVAVLSYFHLIYKEEKVLNTTRIHKLQTFIPFCIEAYIGFLKEYNSTLINTNSLDQYHNQSNWRSYVKTDLPGYEYLID
eukprot:254036_1